MELKKVIDGDYLQIYTIKKPNKNWLKKFPNKSIIISYNLETKIVTLKNTNEMFDWNIFKDLTYIFTTISETVISKMFKDITDEHINVINKKCGLNAGDQNMYDDKHNLGLTLFSLNKYEYPPTFIDQSINIMSNYDEIINLNKDKFNKAITNIYNKNNKPLNSFVEFVESIQKKFPLNYMLTIRRFYSVIKESDLKGVKNNKKADLYVGYDAREIDNVKENNLIKHMEELTYSDNDMILLYETYNNPMEKIIKQCEDKHIKYEMVHKHCIKMNVKNYNKLDLVSSICDYL